MEKTPESIKIPQCIGIILDGNRRWAKERGLPSLEGHRKGAERLKECAEWVRARGIAHMAVYAFSSENWKRSPEEVGYMMKLFVEFAGQILNEKDKKAANIRFVGDTTRAPQEVQDAIRNLEAANPADPTFTLWVCFSYGGRSEIVAAAEALRKENKEVTDESLRSAMWSAGMPDPDIIIRTGGDHRLSNFLMWQSAYSELFFVNDYWPDFSEKTLDSILGEFGARERRFGK